MEKMIVIIFDSEAEVNKGADALKELDREGTISVYSGAVIKKNPDGTVTALDAKEEWPIRAVGGTAIGSLIGLLGGPIGVALGASTGLIVGTFSDLYRSGVSTDFLEDVANNLSPGKYALVADLSEEYIVPLDTKMEDIGGEVFRTRKEYVEEDQLQRDINELDADIDRMEKELADSRVEHKAKLQAKIQKAKQKRDKKIQQLKQRKVQLENEHQQKVKALKAKASKAHAERKAAIEARVAQINKDCQETLKQIGKNIQETSTQLDKDLQETSTKLKNLTAETLEKMADQLDQKAQQLKTTPAQ